MIDLEQARLMSFHFWSTLNDNPTWPAFHEALALRGPVYKELHKLAHNQDYLDRLSMTREDYLEHAADKLPRFLERHAPQVNQIDPFAGLTGQKFDYTLVFKTAYAVQYSGVRLRGWFYNEDVVHEIAITAQIMEDVVTLHFSGLLPQLDLTLKVSKAPEQQLRWEYHHTVEGVSFESEFPIFHEHLPRLVQCLEYVIKSIENNPT